ncbi:unnamed protein product [Closterium sp. NIES-54]
MHSHLLVSGLPRSLAPLPPSPAPPCLPCVEGRQRAAPHSSSFPPMTAPLQTLHMNMWGPARVILLQLRERFREDLSVLRLHSDRGGEFSSDLLLDFSHGEGILQSFTLPSSPQQNGVANCPIGLVMEVARTSMIHAAAPRFLWPFAVRYATHQLNLWPRVSLPETLPTLRWTGKVGDGSVFQVWGSRAFVRNTSTDKLSSRAIPCVFLGFPPDTPGWQFYHPTSHRVFPSQDVTFDESVPFYRLFPVGATLRFAFGLLSVCVHACSIVAAIEPFVQTDVACSTQAPAGPEKDEGCEEPAAVGKVTLHSLDDWVIDSGATYSMTPRADLLTELEPSPVKHLTSALGQRAEVKGMGKAMLKGADGKMVGLKNREEPVWVYVLSKKSDVAETVKTDWLPMVERQQDRLVKAIRTDRGGEFLGKEFSLWLKKNGIRHSLTMPYSPAMNGIAERANRTITETARGLPIEAGLPTSTLGFTLDVMWRSGACGCINGST